MKARLLLAAASALCLMLTAHAQFPPQRIPRNPARTAQTRYSSCSPIRSRFLRKSRTP